MKRRHKLLQRQIQRNLPPDWISLVDQPPLADLLDSINQSYFDFEADRALLERAMDISSQELQEQQQKLIQSTKLASLGEMSASIAHELNNPLYLISGFHERTIKTLKKENPILYGKVEDHLNEITDGISRMRTIINHMREFARQSKHEMGLLEINEPIEKSFQLMQEQLNLGNIRLTKDLCEPSPQVIGDNIKLQQVFVNLISNARDAIEQKNGSEGGEITVTTRCEDGVVTITFQDDGCGMSEVTQSKVFDAFFTTKEVGKGTGLGGSISYGIVKEHKGDIECESIEGQGSTFRITLPVAEANPVMTTRAA